MPREKNLNTPEDVGALFSNKPKQIQSQQQSSLLNRSRMFSSKY